MTENDENPHINNDPMEKKKRIYRLPLVITIIKLGLWLTFLDS